MRICSHQPSFFPWIGYWNKVACSDLLIMSAGVKLDYGGYQNRVRFNNTWLTVPLRAGSKHIPIRDVRFHRDGLQKTMFTIRQALGGKRWLNGQLICHIVDETFARVGHSDFLLDLNVVAFEVVRDALKLKTAYVIDDQEPEPWQSKTERLLTRIMTYAVPGSTYMAGQGIKDYLEPEKWNPKFGLEVQVPLKEVDNGTILQLIAKDGEPQEVIRSSFGWSRIDVRKEDFGRCAALG